MAIKPKPVGLNAFADNNAVWPYVNIPQFDWQADIERLKQRRKLQDDMERADIEAQKRAAREAQERADIEVARVNFIRAMEDPQPPVVPALLAGQRPAFIVMDDLEAPVQQLEVNEDEEEPEDEDGPDDREPREERAAPIRPPWGRRPVAEPGHVVFDDPFGRKQPMLNIKEGPSGYRGMTERSTRLPRFKLEYASQDEARMRLEGTLITVQDRMVKVQKIQTVRQDGQVGTGCVAMDQDGDLMYLLFSVDGMNFRSPDPGFIQIGNEAYYFRRKPARVYKQGINSENTYFTKAGRPERVPLFGGVPDHIIIKAFNERPVVLFNEAEALLKSSHRLSDRIAVFKKNGGRLHVAHRDFVLGPLEKGNRVKVQDCCPWVENALNAVGIEAIPVEG
jgi:hypothetical protein